MIELIDFTNCENSFLLYGGHAGDKDGIIYNNENWIIKYPKKTTNLTNVQISYTTTPLSEYLGSKIYKKISEKSTDIEVQDVLLGIKNQKIVVACKDFRNNNEELFDYNQIKNKHSEDVENELDKISTSSSLTLTDLDELEIVMKNNPYFKDKALETRFYEMFIIDSLIGNNDRNEGNWGIIYDKVNKTNRIAPVFDNGASFNPKTSDIQMEKILKDKRLLKDSMYNNALSAFSKDGKRVNPLKYIENNDNEYLKNTLIQIIPKINLNDIYEVIDNVPNEYNGLKVTSDIQKEFYKETVKYKYENVLYPVYENTIKDLINDQSQSNIEEESNINNVAGDDAR